MRTNSAHSPSRLAPGGALHLSRAFWLLLTYRRLPPRPRDEEDSDERGGVVREEVAPEHGVVLEVLFCRQDEEVAKEPYSQDAKHERHPGLAEPDEGPLDRDSHAEADH